MRRSKEFYETLGERTLLDVALDVHMTRMGTYDRSLEWQAKDIQALRYALDTWEPERGSSFAFDASVRDLIKAALKEAELHRPLVDADEYDRHL